MTRLLAVVTWDARRYLCRVRRPDSGHTGPWIDEPLRCHLGHTSCSHSCAAHRLSGEPGAYEVLCGCTQAAIGRLSPHADPDLITALIGAMEEDAP
jgi:hypothetical protein